MKYYDAVVIGAGSAGYAAARTLTAGGAKTALVDGGEQLGGLCILRGCMPTKALLESAHRAQDIRRAAEFGLRTTKPMVDWKAVIARKNKLINDFAGYRANQIQTGPFTFLRGHAAFDSPNSIVITPVSRGGARLQVTAKHFIIATGSVIDVKAITGLDRTPFLTSDSAIHRDHPVKSLIVLGGGPIAVEFAQYFHNMGTRVTLLQRSPRILKNHDPDLAAELEKAFQREGMEVITGTELLSVGIKSTKKKVVFRHQGKETSREADELLYALGRKPAVEGLQLSNAHVQTRSGYIRCNSTMQSSAAHIYAAGDVAGPYEVVHTAILQAETAAVNVLVSLGKSKKTKMRRMDYRLQMEVVFTSPEIATVGLSETAAATRAIPYLSASHPFNDHGKSMIMGAEEGFVKLLADPVRGRILGAAIVGPHASDLIHELAAIMHFKGTVHDLVQMPHYHPTLAEILTYPAEDILERLP